MITYFIFIHFYSLRIIFWICTVAESKDMHNFKHGPAYCPKRHNRDMQSAALFSLSVTRGFPI